MCRRPIFGLVVLGCLVWVRCHAQELEAVFNMEKVKGSVTFFESFVVFNLNTTTEPDTYSWKIHKYLVDYNEEDKCDTRLIGERYGNEGTVTIPGVLTERISLKITGKGSIIGHCLLLQSSKKNKKSCATIRPKAEILTAVAKFSHTIGGTVIFRQALQAVETAVYSDLFFLNRSMQTASLQWAIYKVADGMITNSNKCSNLQTLGNYALSNLTVGSTLHEQRNVFVEELLPLSGNKSILQKHLGIKGPDGKIISCAFINWVKKKEVHVYFHRDNVRGNIMFVQNSPYDPTVMTISITNLRNLAGGYHVHNYPVPQKLQKDDKVCSAEAVSGHWNPFNIDKNKSPLPGKGTNDEYEVGDLSGKYGSLKNKDSIFKTFEDWNLPLFESNSIIGRSVVIHYRNGSRWICSNIVYPEKTVTLVATFRYPVIGFIMMRQAGYDPYSDTSIFVELNYADRTISTKNHTWIIAENMAVDFNEKVEKKRCKTTGQLYNPSGVSLDGNYAEQCQLDKGLRCALGDLSTRLGTLGIRLKNGKAKKQFFTNTYLPLFGIDDNVEQKSILIYQENGVTPLACATIYRVYPVEAIVENWQKSFYNIQGSLQLKQETPFDDASIYGKLHIDNLPISVATYTIRDNPAVEKGKSSCAKDAIGGVFNPFMVNKMTVPLATNNTEDKYPVGDLSGKFGYLDKSKIQMLDFRDGNLDLFGPRSVIGRSLVIGHLNTDPLICGNLSFKYSISKCPGCLSKKVLARVKFEGSIKGDIFLTQHILSHGSLSDTFIIVDLSTVTSKVTRKHNWGIHEQPVTGNCESTGSIFNPFHVDMQMKYNECSLSNPLRCAVGDQSGKLGQYDIGSGQKYYVDVNLPLSGQFSVIGKSFVIYDKANGTKKIACADILPVGWIYVQMTFSKQKANKQKLLNVLATALGIPKKNLVVEYSSTKGKCMAWNVFISGDDAVEIKEKLEKLIQDKNTALDPFTPVTCGSGFLKSSVVVLAMVFQWICLCH